MSALSGTLTGTTLFLGHVLFVPLVVANALGLTLSGLHFEVFGRLASLLTVFNSSGPWAEATDKVASTDYPWGSLQSSPLHLSSCVAPEL